MFDSEPDSEKGTEADHDTRRQGAALCPHCGAAIDELPADPEHDHSLPCGCDMTVVTAAYAAAPDARPQLDRVKRFDDIGKQSPPGSDLDHADDDQTGQVTIYREIADLATGQWITAARADAISVRGAR